MRPIFTISIIIFACASMLMAGAPLTIKLNSGWNFNEAGKTEAHKATVPGCVHTDLLDNKLIPDPFFGLNEKQLQWIGEKDWEYTTTFKLNDEMLDKKNIEINFKGLDTYAEVYLNGTQILKSDNMFREWKVDAKKYLKKDNQIKIVFRNVFSVNLPKWKTAPFRLQAFPNNDQADTMIAVYSRKAQFHYGWDWGPRLITCGIWKDIEITAWNDARLLDFQIVQKNVSEKSADIISKAEIISDLDCEVNISLKINGAGAFDKIVKLQKGINNIRLDYKINNPKLWWTNGLGEPYLYNFEYEIKKDGAAKGTKNYKIGIRSVELVREKDSYGQSFYFKVNGVPVFMKGANYIPQDNFQNRVTLQRYEHIIKSAAEANMNMLRVWGGGIFEDDMFYEMCDKYGILVWHDMMFACGMYPSDEEFVESVKNEIIDNSKRIRNHPSLAFYCGNNENYVAWYNWGWKQKCDEASQKKFEKDMKHLYEEVIPGALYFADSTRAYSYSSPCAGYADIPYGNGDIHYWGVWHGQDPFENYNKNIARFISEYGFQSYPELNTIKKYTRPEDRELHSEVMLSHQRCMADDRRDREYGNRLIKKYMDMNYNTPKDFENYLYVSQVLHAEGGRIAIEAHRKNMPYCMGSLFWQIDDCWPVASWASIDYFGNWKALHYYARRLYAPVFIVPSVNEDKVDISIVSDELVDRNVTAVIKAFDMRGKELSSVKKDLVISKNSSKVYIQVTAAELLKGEKKENSYIEMKLLEGEKTVSEKIFYLTVPKNLNLLKADGFEYTVKENGNETEVELKTNVLMKDVWVSIPDETAAYSDNYFDLAPGTVKKIVIKTENKISGLREKLKIISLRDSY